MQCFGPHNRCGNVSLCALRYAYMCIQNQRVYYNIKYAGLKLFNVDIFSSSLLYNELWLCNSTLCAVLVLCRTEFVRCPDILSPLLSAELSMCNYCILSFTNFPPSMFGAIMSCSLDSLQQFYCVHLYHHEYSIAQKSKIVNEHDPVHTIIVELCPLFRCGFLSGVI